MSDKNNTWLNNQGNGIKIAVIDSGVYSLHPKLIDCKFHKYNLLDTSSNVDDKLGHGTAVIGIIKNHVPNAKIIVLKLFDQSYTIDFLDFCDALNYVYKHIDYDILNLSIGITECPDHNSLIKICRKLSNKGILISAFDNFGAISYPAAYPFVIGVDSNEKYINPLDYDYIEDSYINIRGKGGNQRLFWNGPDYIIQSGSSFTCAHITGLTAKIMENKINKKNMILHKLRENAIHLYTSKSYRINKPKFNIEQAICMPYNKEIDTLIRNHSMLDFFLCGVFDTKYNLNVGKKITSYIVNDIEKINWQDEFDTVILGHIKELSRLTNFDYYNYIYDHLYITFIKIQYSIIFIKLYL